MADKTKNNEFDEEKALSNEEFSPGEIKLEDNDNWEFEATAHTLENTVVENDEFEIVLPGNEEDISKTEVSFSEDEEEPETEAETEAEAEEETEEAEEPEEKKEDKPEKPKKGSAFETRERPSAKKEEDKESKATSKTSAKGKKNAAKFICGALVGLICIVVLFLFGWRYYTVPNAEEKMNPGNVAITVGDEDVSIGMYNYYYNTIFQNYLSYAQQGYYQIDTTKSYDKQTTTDQKTGKTVTWAKLFKSDTLDRLQYILALYQSGVENGVTLTKEQEKSIKENIKSLKSIASDSDMSVDEYIQQTYGNYCGLATIKKMLTQAYIANNYYRQFLIENKPTEKEVNAYFDKHEDDYTVIKMAYIPIPYNPDDATAKEKAEKKAKKYAKDIKSVKDMKLVIPKACSELIEQYVNAGYFQTKDECAEAISSNIEIDIKKSDTSFTNEAVTWLFNDKTKVKSCTTVTDSENAVVYIIFKVGKPHLDDDETYSVRHILITPESSDDKSESEENATKTYTKKAWADAKKEANKILKEYKDGDKTEYAFSLLAEKYSDDTESTSNGQSGNYGGLYEGVGLGDMVPTFEKWSTDKSRKYGDTGIVKSDYGYHIMFFIEDVPSYYQDCEKTVLDQKGEDFIDSFEIVKHKKAMEKTTVAKPEEKTNEEASSADQAVNLGTDQDVAEDEHDHESEGAAQSAEAE